MAAPSNDRVHIKKFNHSEPFLYQHFTPFEAEHPEYQALLFTYADDRYKSLLVPTEMAAFLDDECPRTFDPVPLQDSFTVTGNDGFQYQSKEKKNPSNTRFHFGMTRIYAHKPFSDYHIMIKLDEQTWTYRAQASDFSRYILDDTETLEAMHAILANSPFVLTSADNLLEYLFSEKESYENFSHLINLFSMVLGPGIIQFHAFDERNFSVQAEHTYVNCLRCYVTCYDQSTPTIIQGGGIISGSDCKIIKVPPVDDDDDDPPPPPPPVPLDPLGYVIQNYPSTPENKLCLAPPLDRWANYDIGTDDAFNTSLWRPCKGDMRLDENGGFGAKSDFSMYCPYNASDSTVEGYFYRVTNDTYYDTPFGDSHEMFEVRPNGIFIQREIINMDEHPACHSDTVDYNHRLSPQHKWFPRWLYLPAIFVEFDIAFHEWCGYTDGNPFGGQWVRKESCATPVPKQDYDPQFPLIQMSENLSQFLITISPENYSVPDPFCSRLAAYCQYQGEMQTGDGIDCGTGLKLIYEDGTYCYTGPVIELKGFSRQAEIINPINPPCQDAKEIYYYGKDYQDPSITWGYTKYDCVDSTANCQQNEMWFCGNYTRTEYYSTKYFPDLKPSIPVTSERGY